MDLPVSDGFVLRDGFWWPADDDWCWRVIHEEVAELDDVLARVPGRRLAVQAGGNVGVWAARLAQVFETVLTFEPVAVNYACLLRNVPANVRPQQAGLGDRAGTLGLSLVPGNAGAHWLVGRGDVPVITIDSLDLPACDFLCLDIEGMEPLALRGAEQTIRRHHPVIQIEEKGLSQKYYGIGAGKAERWLRKLGYRVVHRVRKDLVLVYRGPR